MSRKLKIIGFIIALLLLGFFREHLFVNINALLHFKYYGLAYSYFEVSPVYHFLDRLSYWTLYTSKWFITLAFVALFWFLQKKFIAMLFSEKKAIFWLRMLYLSLLLLAGISFVAGWLLGHLNEGYRFSRIFMGLLQSPAPCMLLIPLTYFYKQNQNI